MGREGGRELVGERWRGGSCLRRLAFGSTCPAFVGFKADLPWQPCLVCAFACSAPVLTWCVTPPKMS